MSRLEPADLEQGVYELVVMGAGLRKVMEIAKENDWPLTVTAATAMVRRAREEFKGLSVVDFTLEFGRALARLDLIFYQSMMAADPKTALASQKEINVLLGFKGRRHHSKHEDPLRAALEKINGN